MNDDAGFAATIDAYFPEGLTGIFAIGGTRTAYMLARNRDQDDPGKIDDFADYAHYTLDQYLRLLRDFFDLGGKNLIIPPLSYQSFYERGDDYTRVIVQHTMHLTNEKAVQVYKQYEVDPYFVGIDTLLHLPTDQPGRSLGDRLAAFQRTWTYNPQRRKVIWEIAPIPLYSFWRAHEIMPHNEQAALETAVRQADDMRVMYRLLFSYFARAVIGTEIPVPHFYVGTNRNGDLKLRSMVPISMLAGGSFRLFYLPYPSLFMTRSVLQTIMQDLIAPRTSPAKNYDYSGRYTPDQMQAEYERVMDLISDPTSIVGLRHQ